MRMNNNMKYYKIYIIGKICPRKMHDGGDWSGWNEFKNEVQEELKPNQQPNQQSSSWAKKTWEWAVKNNITDGTNPKGSLTREQFITILYRYDHMK